MQTFGECSISIGGRRYTLRGEAEFDGIGGLETSVEPNMDGSVFQTAKTAPVTLKISLEDEVDARLGRDDLVTARDIVFVEIDGGRTHYLSAAKIAGKIGYNPASGAISGISFACAASDYRRV